jgi:hypothetical protein
MDIRKQVMHTEAQRRIRSSGLAQTKLQYAKQQMGMRYEMNSRFVTSPKGKGRNTFAVPRSAARMATSK